jgi:hypothetical protein
MGGNFISIYYTATTSISLLAMVTCASYDQLIHTFFTGTVVQNWLVLSTSEPYCQTKHTGKTVMLEDLYFRGAWFESWLVYKLS